jgi:predicted anti-sigma-YlaC factor YlaD
LHCEEALLLISGHLDNENTELEEARLHKHLQDCQSCREVLENFCLVDSGLLSLTEEAPEDLNSRVMAAVRAEAKPKKRRSPWITVAASAAAVALVVGLGWHSMPKPSVENSADPMMVRNVEDELQAKPLTVRSVDGETVSQEIGAPVVVLDAWVQELEGLSYETLSDGSRLYTLQTDAAAQKLGETYGGTLYWPDQNGAKVTYACSFALVPAQ